MIYFERGGENDVITSEELQEGLNIALKKLGARENVLVIPPDFTRFHSRAGELTTYTYQYYQEKIRDILPALGTHVGITSEDIDTMFPGVPHELIRVHDWRNDVVTTGMVPGEVVSELTDGALDYEWPAQVNKLVWEGGHDLILSIGQVVPHEVIGMANYNKNILVGTGGAEGINKSHFVGAVYGMENVMGRADNPVRQLLNYASDHFTSKLPIVYVHTVVARDDETGKLVTRGLFVGDDYSVFTKAAELSLKVNFTMLDEPIKEYLAWK